MSNDWLSASLTVPALQGHKLKLIGAKFKTRKKRAAGTPQERALQMIPVSVASREG